MKLKSYQLARWCDAALLGKRKWLYPAANALLLLLAWPLHFLWLMLPALLFVNAVLALYLLHRHHAFGAVYQRTPRPKDALCETVTIDAALIGQGTRLRAAAQPVDVAESLSMRLGSGALLLGAAMTLTADALPPADRAAILSAVQSLNIKPDRMRSHNPVLAREEQGSITVVTVRDGMNERRYYLGAPMDVAALCPAIWEGSTRPLSDHDKARIADTERYITQANCRVMAWGTALNYEQPIFLGMAGVGEDVHISALSDVAELRTMGLTVMLDAAQADTDLASLRMLLELPDHHARPDIRLTPDPITGESALGVTRVPGESLVEPIAQLRLRFRTIEDTLRRFALFLGIALGVAVLSGSTWMPLFITALVLFGAIAIGVDLTAPKLRTPTAVILLLIALLTRLFLLSQPGMLTLMASGLIALCAAVSAVMRLCGQGFVLKGAGSRLPLAMLGASALMALTLIVIGVMQGAAVVLPLAFAVLVGAAVFLLIALEDKILR